MVDVKMATCPESYKKLCTSEDTKTDMYELGRWLTSVIFVGPPLTLNTS